MLDIILGYQKYILHESSNKVYTGEVSNIDNLFECRKTLE